MKKIVLYLLISFGWTWSFWIIAFLLNQTSVESLDTSSTIFQLFSGFNGQQAIFTLGVFGPMIGYIFVRSKKKHKFFRGYIRKKYAVLAIFIPFVIIIPNIILSIVLGYYVPSNTSLFLMFSSILFYFISNFFTSGTEEFGWRGFLFPALREKHVSFWNATWKSGLIWAAWHFPLILWMYQAQDPAILLPSLFGFTAGIVGMTYIMNFIYEKTQSIGLLMLMHALNNTSSFIVLQIFPLSPFSILSHLMVWGVVAYLEKKYHIEKPLIKV